MIGVIARRDIFRRLFSSPDAVDPVAKRWTKAAEDQPELVEDLIRLGGILAHDPDTFQDGVAIGPVDPIRMAKLQGRRELAIELAALMTLTGSDLSNMMETDDASLRME